MPRLRSLPWRRIRLGVLLATLTALCVVALSGGLDLRPLAGGGPAEPPLPPGLTDRAVLDFLDGKRVDRLDPARPSSGRLVKVTLRKGAISSLVVERDGGMSFHVRFRLAHEGRSDLVDGWFPGSYFDEQESYDLTTGRFYGYVVPGR